MITLIDVFDKHFKDAKIDRVFIERVYRYQVAFLNRDAEHLAFFGSNLIGVHVIRFRVADILKFFKDVCDVDYNAIKKDLSEVSTVVQEYKITSDPMNLTIMYLIHRILTSPKLSESQRERGAYDMALIFFYRCIAIRQSDYFHFPADPKIAQAAYAQLSNMYLIKREGTWRGVMEYRAKRLLEKKGLHYEALVSFTDDGAITYAISDSENRIRNLYNQYYKVFHKAYTEGSRINSTSSTMIDADGEEKIREKVKSTEQYVNYIRTAILDKHGFVRIDLIKAIIDINTNTSQRTLTATLEWLSDHYGETKYHKRIDDWLNLIIVHSFHLLQQADATDTRDYPSMLTLLKNLYLSTRSSDKELMEIRKIGDELIKAANGSVNKSLAMATRTATILYITLRAIAIPIGK